MNTPKAILIGFALVAAAIFFTRDVGPAQAALEAASFQAVAGPSGVAGSIWRVNSNTGSVSFCIAIPDKMISPARCSPWTK